MGEWVGVDFGERRPQSVGGCDAPQSARLKSQLKACHNKNKTLQRFSGVRKLGKQLNLELEILARKGI